MTSKKERKKKEKKKKKEKPTLEDKCKGGRQKLQKCKRLRQPCSVLQVDETSRGGGGGGQVERHNAKREGGNRAVQ